MWYSPVFHSYFNWLHICVFAVFLFFYAVPESCNSILVECWNHDQKVVSSNPGRSGRRIFFSSVNFVCWLSFSVCPIPVLLQWHVKLKDPGHSAKSEGGSLHLNMLTPMTWQSQNGLIMLLTRHSMETFQKMSSHTVCHCWATVDWSWPLEWNLCVHANLHFQKKRKAKHRLVINGRTFFPKCSRVREKGRTYLCFYF